MPKLKPGVYATLDCQKCGREVKPNREVKKGVKYICRCGEQWTIDWEGNVVDRVSKEYKVGKVKEKAKIIIAYKKVLSIVSVSKYTDKEIYEIAYRYFDDVFVSIKELIKEVENSDYKFVPINIPISSFSEDLEGKVFLDCTKKNYSLGVLDVDNFEDVANAVISLRKKDAISFGMFCSYKDEFRNPEGPDYIKFSHVPDWVDSILISIFFSETGAVPSGRVMSSRKEDLLLSLGLVREIVRENVEYLILNNSNGYVRSCIKKTIDTLANNWPDPDRAGVPMNPDKDGTHLISGKVMEWSSKFYCYKKGNDYISIKNILINGYAYEGEVVRWIKNLNVI